MVALGEGLETQFWRVDNGAMRWLTVDLPEVVELRGQLMPSGDRQSSHVGSALDLGWLDGLDPARPTLVTAQGLLPYFQRDEVHGLLCRMAESLPGAALVFDVVPEAMLAMVRRASGRERDLAVELWTWLFSVDERAAVRALPGIVELCDLAPPLKPDVATLGVSTIPRLPQRLRYSVPVIHVLEARFRSASAR